MEETSSDVGSEDVTDHKTRSTKQPTGTRNQRPSKRRKEIQQEDSLLQKALECMERTGSSKESDRDPDIIFGEYVATELKAVKDEHKKRFIKFQIQSLLFSALNPQPPPTRPHSLGTPPPWENPHSTIGITILVYPLHVLLHHSTKNLMKTSDHIATVFLQPCVYSMINTIQFINHTYLYIPLKCFTNSCTRFRDDSANRLCRDPVDIL